MQKNNIQIAVIQDTNLNEKSDLKNPTGYSIILENRLKEGGKSGGVAFIIKNTILFPELWWRIHCDVAVMQDTKHQSVNYFS